jgi:VanZ family protein
MSSLARRVSLWAPLFGYMAAIYLVSSMPRAPLPEQVSDKTGHVLAYIGMGVLAVRAVAGGLPRRVTMRMAIATVLITTVHGALDELHQSYVPGRSSDIQDVYADSIGGCIGLAVCWVWGIIRTRSDV